VPAAGTIGKRRREGGVGVAGGMGWCVQGSVCLCNARVELVLRSSKALSLLVVCLYNTPRGEDRVNVWVCARQCLSMQGLGWR
jgi:hypothetical protein